MNNKTDIKEILKDLSWYKTKNVQKKAMNELLKVSEKEVILLLQQGFWGFFMPVNR